MNNQKTNNSKWSVFEANWVVFFLIANLACFALSLLLSESYPRDGVGDPAGEALYLLGAKQTQLILDGQIHRLITPCLLHGSIWHLLFNCYFLWQLGPLCQAVLGNRRFLSLYLLTAITGCLGGVIWDHFKYDPAVFWASPIAIGASTSMFGILGFLLLWAKRTGGAEHIYRQLMICLLINLAIGASSGVIDNAGHIGGLAGGLIFALAATSRRPQAWHRLLLSPQTTLVLSLAAVASVISVAVLYFGSFGETCRTLYEVRPAVASLYPRGELTPNLALEYADEVKEIREGKAGQLETQLGYLEAMLRREASDTNGPFGAEPFDFDGGGVRNSLEISTNFRKFIQYYLSIVTWSGHLVPIGSR